MDLLSDFKHKTYELRKSKSAVSTLIAVISGATTPLGFAPFHLPGAAILSIAILYVLLQSSSIKQACIIGTAFGLGFMGVGVSWVTISIHTYGHLNLLLSITIAAMLVFYLAMFFGLMTSIYRFLAPHNAPLTNGLLFSGLWCVCEYLRATCFTGFPWLSLGFGQIDTPLKYVLPIFGIYGLSFMTVLSSTLLSNVAKKSSFQFVWLLGFVLLLITPASLKFHTWTQAEKTPLSVGIIQANLSMRDKWNETLFWKILGHYQSTIEQLLGNKELIVLPESAIPLPAIYIQEFLTKLHTRAQKKHSAILIGIPQETTPSETEFYNTMSTLGAASGAYKKQHLVPFGEFIPKIVAKVMLWLDLPLANMKPGNPNQSLIKVNHRPLASLVCYELAYPQLLRAQLPTAQWIVSISDDGWFGHSLAIYQQLQMAQALSILTGRYQIVANNDGLSSIITEQGVVRSLPAFTSGILEGVIYPTNGTTPWVTWGDAPILTLCWLLVIMALFKKRSIQISRFTTNSTIKAMNSALQNRQKNEISNELE